MHITGFEDAVNEDVKAFQETMGAYFKDIRVKFGLDTHQVAIFLDVSEERVKLFEEGKHMLPAKEIATLARSYSQTLRDVFLNIATRLH